MEKYRKLIPGIQPATLTRSEITYKCYVWSFKQARLGLIAFHGTYALGSAGKKDAQFIKWRIDEFCVAEPYRIDGLVIDFRGLDYQWGDDMEIHPKRLIGRGETIRIVINPEEVNPDIYSAYMWALNYNYVRTDLATAIQEVNELANTVVESLRSSWLATDDGT